MYLTFRVERLGEEGPDGNGRKNMEGMIMSRGAAAVFCLGALVLSFGPTSAWADFIDEFNIDASASQGWSIHADNGVPFCSIAQHPAVSVAVPYRPRDGFVNENTASAGAEDEGLEPPNGDPNGGSLEEVVCTSDDVDLTIAARGEGLGDHSRLSVPSSERPPMAMAGFPTAGPGGTSESTAIAWGAAATTWLSEGAQ